jgi:hypothetical protein
MDGAARVVGDSVPQLTRLIRRQNLMLRRDLVELAFIVAAVVRDLRVQASTAGISGKPAGLTYAMSELADFDLGDRRASPAKAAILPMRGRA